MIVSTQHSGAIVTVFKYGGFDSPYITAMSDIRYPGLSKIELVRSGHVREYHSVYDYRAPELIVSLMRKL